MSAVKIDRVFQLLLLVCLAGMTWAIADTFEEKVVMAGDKAPDFKIVSDTGRTVSRSDFGGRLLVLNFWATWCPPCIEELPSLDRFQRDLAGSGVVVLGVSVDENAKAYQDLLDKAKPSFLTARDPEARISAEYGTFKYPETYIINGEGKVVEKMIGPRTWTDPELVSRVKSLLGA
jgi:peroxiredoxin